MGFYSVLVFCFFSLVSVSVIAQSVCYGTTSNGKLKEGVALPLEGGNFVSYGKDDPLFFDRIYVHSEVRKILLSTYKVLENSLPGRVYKYAETGFVDGGEFKPHRTHKNGLSVDHMVPVLRDGKSVHLPTVRENRMGYDIEFDINGNFEDYQIDYNSLATFLMELHKQTVSHGYGIKKIIFDPEMQASLFSATNGEYLKNNILFSKKRAWVRHDEHIHIDFNIPCQSM